MANKNCDQCGNTFSSAQSLSRHKRNHNQSNKVTCDICGKQFRSDNLKKHKDYCKTVVFYSDENIVKCDICRMEFHTEAKLKQHSQVHMDNKI